MSLVLEKLETQLQSPQQESISEQLTVSTPEVSEDLNETIPHPEIFDISVEDMPCLQRLQQQPQPTQENAIATNQQSSEQTPETALTKSEPEPSLPTQHTGGITEAQMTQAIAQAVQQVGASSNAEAVHLLTSLANELASDINDVQEMVATLVTAYLNKRQSVLSAAVNTINQFRSAQTESFQAGLTTDFFGQKQKNKQGFLDKVQVTFN
jgi:hypothetical protein